MACVPVGVLVFKISGRQRKTGCGGFDSHAIPIRCVSAYRERCAGRVRTKLTERLHPKLFGLKLIPDCAQRGCLRPNRPTMRFQDQVGRIQRKAFLRPRSVRASALRRGRPRAGKGMALVAGWLAQTDTRLRIPCPFAWRRIGLRRSPPAARLPARVPRATSSGSAGREYRTKPLRPTAVSPIVWHPGRQASLLMAQVCARASNAKAMHSYASCAGLRRGRRPATRGDVLRWNVGAPRGQGRGMREAVAENVGPMAFRSAEKKAYSPALAPRTPYCGTLWCRLKVAARHFLPLSKPPSFACGRRGRIRARAASG